MDSVVGEVGNEIWSTLITPAGEILKESLGLLKASPRTFLFITLILVLPLSLAMLTQTIFTAPLLNNYVYFYTRTTHCQWIQFLVSQFFFAIFIFLSAAAVVFTASLYTSKPVSFTSTLSAIPRVFYRLLVTFLFISLLIFLSFLVFIPLAIPIFNYITFQVLGALYIVVCVYIATLWHLASVVSVLEPTYGLSALKKSRQLLKGRTGMGFLFMYAYFGVCGLAECVFAIVLVCGGSDYRVLTKVAVGVVLVGVLVILNLFGLLVQCVFYYSCKSLHNEETDKTALKEHLGGYLVE